MPLLFDDSFDLSSVGIHVKKVIEPVTPSATPSPVSPAPAAQKQDIKKTSNKRPPPPVHVELKRAKLNDHGKNTSNEAIFRQLRQVEKEETILREDEQRYLIFPIQHEDMWDMFEKHHKAEWKVSEVTEMEKDRKDYENATPGEQRLFDLIMAFFAGSDGIVMENLAARMINIVQVAEARAFYSMQIKMEMIHQIMYGKLLVSIVADAKRRHELMQAIQTIPVIRAKARWGQKWIERDDVPFAVRLVAFAAVEGVFFSSSFCGIFWFKRRSKFPATVKSNEWIARDEGLHTDFACLLYGKLENKVPTSMVHQIIDEAVKLEQQFVQHCLPEALPGLSADDMCKYVEFIADRLLQQLGHPTLYQTTNPFEWMEMIGLRGKTNFHEREVSDYSQYVNTRPT